jgi:hypothetical protein
MNKEELEIDFKNFSKNWENTEIFNNQIYEYFESKVNDYDILNNHNETIGKLNYGYGEKAFRYLWLLLFSQIPQNGKFLEIGVYKGSILALSQICSNSLNKNIQTYGLTPLYNASDKYSEYPAENYTKCIEFLFSEFNLDSSKVNIIKGLSTNINTQTQAIEHGEYDIIYIDGGHDYETVISDINLCNKLLKINGFLVMDDASSFLNMPQKSNRFSGHHDVGLAIEHSIDKDENYKHLFACGHNRVWQKIK